MQTRIILYSVILPHSRRYYLFTNERLFYTFTLLFCSQIFVSPRKVNEPKLFFSAECGWILYQSGGRKDVSTRAVISSPNCSRERWWRFIEPDHHLSTVLNSLLHELIIYFLLNCNKTSLGNSRSKCGSYCMRYFQILWFCSNRILPNLCHPKYRACTQMLMP